MLDVNQDNDINYDEFVSALYDSKKINEQMNIDYIFHHIDSDQSGQINAEELKTFLAENDVSYLEVDVNAILQELDKNGDGVIT